MHERTGERERTSASAPRGGRREGSAEPDEVAEGILAAAWARANAELAEERDSEVADRIRAAWGEIGMADRLTELVGAPLLAHMAVVGPVAGLLESVGDDWIRVSGVGGTCYLFLRHLVRLELSTPTRWCDRGLASRVGATWTAAGRALAAAGRPVALVGMDGGRLRGVIRRVGRDHIDLVAEDVTERSGAAVTPIPMQLAVIPVASIVGLWVH